jgi:hypothetical protein
MLSKEKASPFKSGFQTIQPRPLTICENVYESIRSLCHIAYTTQTFFQQDFLTQDLVTPFTTQLDAPQVFACQGACKQITLPTRKTIGRIHTVSWPV